MPQSSWTQESSSIGQNSYWELPVCQAPHRQFTCLNLSNLHKHSREWVASFCFFFSPTFYQWGNRCWERTSIASKVKQVQWQRQTEAFPSVFSEAICPVYIMQRWVWNQLGVTQERCHPHDYIIFIRLHLASCLALSLLLALKKQVSILWTICGGTHVAKKAAGGLFGDEGSSPSASRNWSLPTTLVSLRVDPSQAKLQDENAAQPHLGCNLVIFWSKEPGQTMYGPIETVR